MKISKDVVGHNIDQVWMVASVMAVMLSSEKNKKRQRDIMNEVFDERFENEKKFKWSQEAKMIDWGHYINFPSWIHIKPTSIPFSIVAFDC